MNEEYNVDEEKTAQPMTLCVISPPKVPAGCCVRLSYIMLFKIIPLLEWFYISIWRVLLIGSQHEQVWLGAEEPSSKEDEPADRRPLTASLTA